MPDYELHADYDRNGRLDAASAEHARRGTGPGAVVVPNLDIDSRSLPATVTLEERRTLDRDQPVVLAGDDEALPLRIKVNAATAPAGSRFFLRPLGFPRIRIRLNDAAGRILPRDLSRENDIPVAVPAAPGILDLSLTTSTLPGSPHGHVTDLEVRFSLDTVEESAFSLQLLSVDPAGLETLHDTARFSVAPFVLLDQAAVAERVYICDLPGNHASVFEMEAALRLLRVPLVKVPEEVAMGDTWLQDQFQHALVEGPDGWRQVILHLPRLRAESSNGTGASNLSTFVVSHFPSRNIGLFDDFWRRDLQFLDSARRPRRLPFRHCDRLAVVMMTPFSLARLLVDHLKRLDSKFDPEWPHTGENDTTTWSDVRGWLPVLVEEYRRRARRAGEAGNAELAALYTRHAADARERLNRVSSLLPYDAVRCLARLPVRASGIPGTAGSAALAASSPVEVPADEANRIFDRVQQMHHSSNYGGNIEASPPLPGAPFGKILIGNSVVDGERDFMDPDVLRLLYKQRKQPVVEVDSSWLEVGHVDEFIAFAPDRRGSGPGFAVLRASSRLALRILEEADRRYRMGLPIEHPHRFERRMSGVLERLTVDGSSPVTRMFRGKTWKHIHGRAEGDAVPQVLEPPRIYQDVSHGINGSDETDPHAGGINIHGIRYWPGEGPPRAYPADITVREALYGEEDLEGNSTNAFIEERFLAPAAEILRTAFPGARLLPLPVLFDRVTSTRLWRMSPSSFATSAFTPDVVNLQGVNGRLLLPRPYGPRMALADARAVLAAAVAPVPVPAPAGGSDPGAGSGSGDAAPAAEAPAPIPGIDLPSTLLARIDEAFIRRHRLRTGVYWLSRESPVHRPISASGLIRTLYEGLETEEQVINQFKDSFPGASAAELRRRIILPNRRHFNGAGRLREGARRFEIAETGVDLFETFIHAVAEELDIPLTFIDSWHYHIHFGGIHCGTNVLRRPARTGTLPRVWEAPDVEHLRTVEMEADEISAPAPAAP